MRNISQKNGSINMGKKRKQKQQKKTYNFRLGIANSEKETNNPINCEFINEANWKICHKIIEERRNLLKKKKLNE